MCRSHIKLLKRSVGVSALVVMIAGAFALFQSANSTEGGAVPKFTYDGSWPKLPLPNKWTFEGITGLAVDKDDVIWVLNRPGDFDIDPIFHVPEKTENYAALNPPTALCCLKPEGILAFDMQGNLKWSKDLHETGRPADLDSIHLSSRSQADQQARIARREVASASLAVPNEVSVANANGHLGATDRQPNRPSRDAC